MIRASRREAIMGMAAVPTLAGVPQWRWRHGEASVLVYDPALLSGRRFAAAGQAHGAQGVELAGDRIRLAQRVLAARPALVAGVSLAADAFLLEEVGREHGYARVALFSGAGESCLAHDCADGWQALGRLAEGAGAGWIEALAAYAARPGAQVAAQAVPGTAATESALGWLLAPRD